MRYLLILFASALLAQTPAPGPQGSGSSSAGGSGTVTSIILAGTANQITLTGTCTVTTTGTCTFSIPSALQIPGTINKITLTQPATGSTLTIIDGKTVTANNSVIFTGTDGSTLSFGAGGTLVYAGADINSSNQVTATHLAAALPVNQGGTGTTSTLTGLIRGNSSALTAAELSGDATTSASNVVTVAKVNGTTVPTNSTADQLLGTTASATAAWTSVPNCGDSSHALAYNTTTHVFSCQSVTGVAGSPTFPINAQTTTYQVLAADFTACKVISVASGTFTATLVASGSQPTTGQCIWILNYGSGVVTIARSGQNINGAAGNLTLPVGSATAPSAAFVVSDGTNYFVSLHEVPAANTCTNQAVTAVNGTAAATCTTLTSAYVNNSIALTGTDINTSNQVTVTHLAAALPLAQGGTNGTDAADNGGVIWSNASGYKILAHTATAGQPLVSGNAATPAWGTDFTWNGTHTWTLGASGIFDLSASSVTGGLKIPAAAGAAPTADDFLAFNTTNHTHVWGSNATTIVGAAAATGTNTATTCSNQFVSAISGIAIPTCTTVTLAGAQFANQGTTTTLLHGNGSGNPAFGAVVSADLNITTTTCTYPSVLTAISATGTGTCTVPTIPQNSQSAAYTTVLADAGKHIYHPSADTTARTWTIDSNANVAYPIGTTLTFVNDTSGGIITIAITTDTLVFAGSGGTGSRSLAASGIATALKVTSTRWIINGTGLT